MFLSLKNSCHFWYPVLYLFLVFVLHKAKIISFAESGMSCVLMCYFIKETQLALVLSTVDVCCLFLVIVDVYCWMLLHFGESLGANSVCSTMVLSVALLMILFLFLIVSSRLSYISKLFPFFWKCINKARLWIWLPWSIFSTFTIRSICEKIWSVSLAPHMSQIFLNIHLTKSILYGL